MALPAAQYRAEKIALASFQPKLANAIKGSKRYVNLADLASRGVKQRTLLKL